MKKLGLLLVGTLLLSGNAFAQKSVVDAVNKEIGGYQPNFASAREKIKPAFTNPETKDDARTWFVAGKTEFGAYDHLLGQLQLRQEVNKLDMANAMLDGYKYFMTALPLDSVVELNKDGSPKLDKKGNKKIKTKYSKDIVGLIVGHHNDFNVAGSYFYDAKEYGKSYEAWGIYCDIAESPMAKANKLVVADTIVGETRFYQAIAAWQGENFNAAIEAFAKARAKGYVKKEAFDYAMACAASAQNNEAIIAIAREAYPLYGKQDTQYISIMINDFINNSKFAEATALLDEAIAANPTNAEFYDVKGSLFENQGNPDKALEFFLKSIELNPDYAKGHFDVGRYYYNKALEARKKANDLKGNEYQNAIENNVKPLYLQALPHLEKAYEKADDVADFKNDVRHALQNIYYFLGDEEKLNSLQ